MSGTEAYVSYEISWTEADGTQVQDILTLFWNNPILSSAKFNYHCTKLGILVDFDSKRHARVIFGIYRKGEAPTLSNSEQLRDILKMRQSLGNNGDESSQSNNDDASNDEYFSPQDSAEENGTKADQHELHSEDHSSGKFSSVSDGELGFKKQSSSA